MSGDSWYEVNYLENNQGITQSHVVLWRTFQNIKVINCEKMKL